MRHILAALKHHKTAVALIALEIALTCAIVSNALFLIGNRLAAMQLTTGVADDELLWLRSSGLRADADRYSQVQADLAALRGMPGVQAAVQMNSLPLSHNDWRSGLSLQPGKDKPELDNVAEYAGTPGFVGALGLHLVQGRDFLAQEYGEFDIFSDKPPPSAVIVTRALAQRLWPGQNPLQQAIYMGDKGKYSLRVVGVVEHLLNPSLRARATDQYNLLLPVKSLNGGMYVLRAAPQQRERILRDAPAALDRVDPERIITVSKTYTQTVADYFRDDRAMVWLLLVVVGCLLALAALGVVGLSSFWVQQRTHQIGIRRAIGATRRDILAYFQIENLLIVGLGVVLGSLAAVELNLWLMTRYELPRMPLAWLPAGAAVLWLLGQLAVLGPALRAAAVPPVAATRAM